MGKIEFISHVPVEGGYLAKVGFTDGLTTTCRKRVQYHSGLLPTAEIVTSDMRRPERFYYNFMQPIRR